jgi:hypothetical protein
MVCVTVTRRRGQGRVRCVSCQASVRLRGQGHWRCWERCWAHQTGRDCGAVIICSALAIALGRPSGSAASAPSTLVRSSGASPHPLREERESPPSSSRRSLPAERTSRGAVDIISIALLCCLPSARHQPHCLTEACWLGSAERRLCRNKCECPHTNLPGAQGAMFDFYSLYNVVLVCACGTVEEHGRHA